jgi:ribose-phosphate pyrophosphokinase
MKIVACNSNRALAEAVAAALNMPLTNASVRRFADMEVFVEIHENVRGEDVFVVQSTSYPANDNLMELLITLDALRRGSAKRATAVIPYFGYARQDRKSGPRTPISAKLVANLITKAGADRVLALDLHAAQIQGFFDIPVDHLYAGPEIAKHVRGLNIPPDELVVLSPDEGSIKKALDFQKRVGGKIAVVDKRRTSATEVKHHHLIGASLEGKTAVIFDDMISTGGTIVGAVNVARNNGAKAIYVCATHGVLCGDAIPKLRAAPIDQITITDSIPLAAEKQLPNLKVISVASLVANAVHRIHGNESISALFTDEPPPSSK